MPRPLPDDVGSVSGFVWKLVPIPDDPAFIRAAWDVFSELANYWQWGLEGPEPDSNVAAQLWADALYEAFRVEEMGFPDVVLTYIDDVENLLNALLQRSDDSVIIDQLCCDGGVVDPIPDETGGDVVVGQGDPPGGIEDWPTYEVLRCSAAQKFVDSLPGWVTILQGFSLVANVGLAAVLAGLVAGLAAAGIAAAAVLGVTGALEFLAAVRDLIDAGPTWQDARDALEDADTKADLVCAIVNADTAEAAEAAIDSYLDGIDSDAAAAVRTLPLRFMMNKIYNAESDAGGYGGPCDCDIVATIEGYRFTATEYLINGSGGNNTNMPCSEVFVSDAAYLRLTPNTAAMTIMSQNSVYNGNGKCIAGTAAPRGTDVADYEPAYTSVNPLNTVIRLTLRFTNGSSGAQSNISVALGTWRLYDADAGVWRNATVTKVSGDARWAASGNQATFAEAGSLAQGSYDAVFDVAYS